MLYFYLSFFLSNFCSEVYCYEGGASSKLASVNDEGFRDESLASDVYGLQRRLLSYDFVVDSEDGDSGDSEQVPVESGIRRGATRRGREAASPPLRGVDFLKRGAVPSSPRDSDSDDADEWPDLDGDGYPDPPDSPAAATAALDSRRNRRRVRGVGYKSRSSDRDSSDSNDDNDEGNLGVDGADPSHDEDRGYRRSERQRGRGGDRGGRGGGREVDVEAGRDDASDDPEKAGGGARGGDEDRDRDGDGDDAFADEKPLPRPVVTCDEGGVQRTTTRTLRWIGTGRCKTPAGRKTTGWRDDGEATLDECLRRCQCEPRCRAVEYAEKGGVCTRLRSPIERPDFKKGSECYVTDDELPLHVDGGGLIYVGDLQDLALKRGRQLKKREKEREIEVEVAAERARRKGWKGGTNITGEASVLGAVPPEVPLLADAPPPPILPQLRRFLVQAPPLNAEVLDTNAPYEDIAGVIRQRRLPVKKDFPDGFDPRGVVWYRSETGVQSVPAHWELLERYRALVKPLPPDVLNADRSKLESGTFTIICAPKPMTDPHIAKIQRNAIRSWAQLEPRPRVIVFGREEGIEGLAAEVGADYVADVTELSFKTATSTIAFYDLLVRGFRLATTRTLVFVNADIILTQATADAIVACDSELEEYLMIGPRWRTWVEESIDFENDKGWAQRLFGRCDANRTQCATDSLRAIDLFAFTRGALKDTPIPNFAIGRPTYDNWLIHAVAWAGTPVVSAHKMMRLWHQNHDYSHVDRKANTNKSTISGKDDHLFHTEPTYYNIRLLRQKGWNEAIFETDAHQLYNTFVTVVDCGGVSKEELRRAGGGGVVVSGKPFGGRRGRDDEDELVTVSYIDVRPCRVVIKRVVENYLPAEVSKPDAVCTRGRPVNSCISGIATNDPKKQLQEGTEWRPWQHRGEVAPPQN